MHNEVISSVQAALTFLEDGSPFLLIEEETWCIVVSCSELHQQQVEHWSTSRVWIETGERALIAGRFGAVRSLLLSSSFTVVDTGGNQWAVLK